MQITKLLIFNAFSALTTLIAHAKNTALTAGKTLTAVIAVAALIALSAVNTAYAGNEDFRKSFTVQPGGSFILSSDYGDIKIFTTNKNEVTVEIKDLDEKYFKNVQLLQQGNTIRLSYRSAGGWNDDLDFKITVPVNFNLDIKTSAGDIDLKNNLTGNVKLYTSGGDIETKNINGNFDCYTSGGDVKPGTITGKANIKTAGGDIVTGSISSDASFSTSGGNISTGNIGGAAKLSTAGGDIVAGAISGGATVSTSGGNINIISIKGRGSVKTAGGSIAVGSSASGLEVKTSGGDIFINSLGGSAEIKTASGDIRVTFAKGNTGNVVIKNSAGDVTISFPAGVKATVNSIVSTYGWDDGSDGFKSAFSSTIDKKGNKIYAKTVINGGGGATVSVNLDMGTLTLKK